MKKIISIFSLLCFLLFIPYFNLVLAQSQLPLTVYPAVQDIKIKAGQKTRTQINFRNESDEIVHGIIRIVDYMVIDNEGTTRIIEDSEVKPKYSAAKWMSTLSKNISIPPHDFVPVDISILPPSELKTCGNYAMVYFEPNLSATKTGDKSGASAVTTKIGGLINLEATNIECKEEMTITSFSANNFQEYGPIEVKTGLMNYGDIHLSPKGYIQISNFFRQTTDQELIKDERIFPESSKIFKNSVGEKWMFGQYKINLKTSYGKDGKTLNTSLNVWVIPWKIILVILIAIGILFFIIKEYYDKMLFREKSLEKELDIEKNEIEILKEKLRKKRE